MRLILVRHAEAVPMGTDGIATDSERPLTELGKQQATKLGELLKAKGIAVSVVMTSPLVRAVQTAELLSQALTPGKELVITERLSLDELRPKKLSKLIFEQGGLPMLVGHMPTIAEYLSWLMNANTDAIDFDKASAAGVSCEYEIAKGGGTLEWLITPSWYL
jgi:phosphohistidine phosphatase